MSTKKTKICSACGAELPATLKNFGPHKTGKYGLFSQCKPCVRRLSLERRQMAAAGLYKVNEVDCLAFHAIRHGQYTEHRTTRDTRLIEFH